MRIVKEDALEVVAGLGEFEYIMTDPPYSVGGRSAATALTSIAQARAMTEAISHSFISAVVSRIRTKPNAVMWLFCTWREISYYAKMLEGHGWGSQQAVVWDKVAPMMTTGYHARFEMVLFAAKGEWRQLLRKGAEFLGPNIIAVQKCSGPDKPNIFAKPPELARQLAQNFKEGRAIDPFCGSGYLLRGLEALNFDCVGVDPAYETMAGLDGGGLLRPRVEEASDEERAAASAARDAEVPVEAMPAEELPR